MSLRNLIETINSALQWVQETGFPNNAVVRELRNSDYITHQGKQLQNVHRSDDKLCDVMAGLIATKRYGAILEIGTLFGYSTLHLAEAASPHRGHVTTVDLRQKTRKWRSGENVEDIHEFAIEQAGRSGLSSSITFIGGRSDVVLPRMVLEGKQYDLIFIDGSHSRYVVLLDLINSFNLLAQDGLIVLDDVSENIAVKEYTHGGPNSVLMHLLGSKYHLVVPLSYNTMIVKPLVHQT